MTKTQVYLFFGTEDYLIDERIKALRAAAGDHEQLDGANLSLETLSNALCGQSLLGGAKLVVIDEAKVAADDQPAVISILQNLAPGTTVVWRNPGIDGRTKLFKWIAANGQAEEFKSFAPWEQAALLRWVAAQSRQRGKAITESAARLLIEISGQNLRLLVNELEKLITYLGDRPQIAEADVAALASPGEASAFALLDKLRRRDLAGALALCGQLLQGGAELFGLLGLIATQYRLMLQIKALPGRPGDPGEIARRIKGSPYFIKKCLDGLERFSLAELKENMALLLETSMRLKSGEQQSVQLEMLIAALCRSGSGV
ncbi:MAG: DNA polymerase III subunit delta [Candidatus Margulisiibacteriota bacterium]